jgi:hypothetical protein
VALYTATATSTICNLDDKSISTVSLQVEGSRVSMRNERNVKKVLLVEDELDINLVFKTVLEYSGFEVDAFNDPLLALQNFVTTHTICYF